MQGRMYTAVFRSVSVSAAQDLFMLVAAAAVSVRIHEILLSCRGGNDERLNIMVHRAGSTSSGGPGAVTSRGLNSAVTTAASSTVRINDTTQGTDGDIVDTWEWDLRTWGQRIPTPETRILVPGGTRLAVSLETSPAGSRTMSGVLVFEELG